MSPSELVKQNAVIAISHLTSEDQAYVDAYIADFSRQRYEAGVASVVKNNWWEAFIGFAALFVILFGALGATDALIRNGIDDKREAELELAYWQLSQACIERVLCECQEGT